MGTHGGVIGSHRKALGAVAWGTALVVLAVVGSAGRMSGEPIPTDPQAPSNLADSDKDIPEIRTAFEKLGQRDHNGAMAAVEEAVKKHPELPPAKVILAGIYFRMNQPQAGRALLEQSAKELPNDPAPLLLMGQLALGEMRLVEAGMLYDKARELSEALQDNDEAKKDRLLTSLAGSAQVAESREEWEKAKELLDQCLKIDEKAFRLRYKLGLALFHLGDTKASYEELVKSARESEEVIPPGVFMGQLYQGKDDNENAKKWMEFALKDKEFGSQARTKVGVARWYFGLGQYEQALKLFEEASKMRPDDEPLRLTLGLNLRYLKRYDEAQKIFEEVYSKSPSNYEAMNQLALVLVEQDDKAKQTRAVELAETNARLNPRNAGVQATLGYVYDKLGRINDAKRRYSDAYQLTGGALFPDLAYYLAKMQVRDGRYDTAKQLLDAALDQKQPFVFRTEAEKLMEEIKPKLSSSSAKPATTPVSTGSAPEKPPTP